MSDSLSAMMLKLARLTTLGALLAMAGCGGGGADASDSAPQIQSPDPAPAATPEPESVVSTSDTRATCNLANFEVELLAAANAYHAAGASCGSAGDFPAAAPLAWNAMLTQAALGHSDDMVASNVFSHSGSDGSGAGQRATAAGYVWRSVAENIAAGQPSVAAVMGSWMASPGHCVNIMRANYRDIGVACVSAGAGNTYRNYWTMTLGSAR